MATVRDDDDAGTTKPATTGGVASGKVMVVVALTGTETFPAVSLAQASRVLAPAEEKA